MKVLLSVKPRYAEAILSGRKRFEYRRAVFKRPGAARVILYASAPARRIVGEFQVKEIIEDTPAALWARTGAWGGLARGAFDAYFAGRARGYALAVEAPVRYASPIDPRRGNPAFVPPQNFRYLDAE